METERRDRFQGLCGIVTGAGSGIGRAVSMRLASEGGRVLAVDIDEAGVSETAAMGGGQIDAHVADVRSPEQVEGYFAAAKRLGPLRFFHNNAGVEGPLGMTLAEMPLEDWERTLAINLTGVFLGLKHALPAMKLAGGGAIVNTGSLMSMRSSATAGAYATSKHGVLALTRTAAAEGAADGIRVNAICPGPVETPLQRRAETAIGGGDRDAGRTWFEEQIPAGRYAAPEEIADLVAYLLKPGMEYFTAAAISVDGGITAIF